MDLHGSGSLRPHAGDLVPIDASWGGSAGTSILQGFLGDFFGNLRMQARCTRHSSTDQGLFSPGTQVFSHYPSDYFPGGWNESMPLQLLGFKKVGPEGPQTLVMPGVRLFLDFMSPKQ